MVHAFVCSKPYQLVSILNLPYDFGNKGIKRLLFVLNHFPDAQAVVDRLPEVFPYWDEIHLIQERFELTALLKQHQVHTLFTDIDTGKVPFRWSLAVREMNVYEEGTQNYRSIRADYIKYPATTKIREFITPLFGWGAYLGSNRKTKQVYLYNPDYFNTHISSLRPKVKPLRKNLYRFLFDNYEALNFLFPVSDELSGIHNQRVALYITSHTLNQEVFDRLQQDAHLYDRILIKVHPHIMYADPHFLKDIEALPFEIIKGNSLAEMMFMTLIRNNNQLTIFHESSTACLYLKESEQVRIFDYRENVYRTFFNGLRNCYLAADYAAADFIYNPVA